MGGGPNNPIPIKDDYDEIFLIKHEPHEAVGSLGSRLNAISIKEEPSNAVFQTHDAIMIDDDDDDKCDILDVEDTDGEIDEAAQKKVKGQLMKELKALGVKPMQRPDYTKPLNEPSWGDSDDEEDSDIDMDVVDDEEDEDDYDEDEEELAAERDDLHRDLKEMK